MSACFTKCATRLAGSPEATSNSSTRMERKTAALKLRVRLKTREATEVRVNYLRPAVESPTKPSVHGKAAPVGCGGRAQNGCGMIHTRRPAICVHSERKKFKRSCF